MYFHLKSMRISSISKVRRVQKGMTVMNKFMLQHFGCVSWISSRSTGLKFPIWTDHNFFFCGNPASQLGYRAHMKKPQMYIKVPLKRALFSRWVWGMLPQKILKCRVSDMLFSAFSTRYFFKKYIWITYKITCMFSSQIRYCRHFNLIKARRV